MTAAAQTVPDQQALDCPDCHGRGTMRLTAKPSSRTYAWLADQLGISSDICHVSMMDLVQLRTAYAALQRATFHGIREWAKELGR